MRFKKFILPNKKQFGFGFIFDYPFFSIYLEIKGIRYWLGTDFKHYKGPKKKDADK